MGINLIVLSSTFTLIITILYNLHMKWFQRFQFTYKWEPTLTTGGPPSLANVLFILIQALSRVDPCVGVIVMLIVYFRSI